MLSNPGEVDLLLHDSYAQSNRLPPASSISVARSCSPSADSRESKQGIKTGNQNNHSRHVSVRPKTNRGTGNIN